MDRTVEVLAKGQLRADVYSLPEVELDEDDRAFALSLSRDAWPEGEVADVLVDVWDEEAGVWQFLCGCQLRGGEHVNNDGSTATHSGVVKRFPGHGKSGRKTRVRIETKKSITTEAKLDIVAAPVGEEVKP